MTSIPKLGASPVQPSPPLMESRPRPLSLGEEAEEVMTAEEMFAKNAIAYLAGEECPFPYPLIVFLQINVFIPLLISVDEIDPHFSLLVDKRYEKESDLRWEFILNLMEFINTGDSSKIKHLLEKIANVINGLKKQHPHRFNNGINAAIAEWNTWMPMFATGRVDLFMRTLDAWKQPIGPISFKDQLRTSVQYCLDLYRGVSVFSYAATPKQDELMVMASKLFCKDVGSEIDLFIFNAALEVKELNRFQALDVYQIYRTLLKSYIKKRHDDAIALNNVYLDFGGNYSFIVSVEARDIIDGKTCNTDHMRKHQVLYESFIPRVRELHDWIVSSSNWLSERSLLLRYFPLYLKFGDMSQLKQSLKETTICHRGQLERILFAEIKQFAEKSQKDVALIPKLRAFFQANELMRSWNTLFSKTHTVFRMLSPLSEAMMGLQLKYADACTAGLFRRNSKNGLSSQSSKKKQHVKTPKSTRVEDSEESEKAAPKHDVVKSQKQQISVDGQFQRVKEKTTRVLVELEKKCSGFETQVALRNAQIHLVGFLATMRRMVNDKSLTRQELLCHSSAMIRHGSLAAEQMLSALDRESNHLKDFKQLQAHLSHDLVAILFSCKFEKKDLHHQFRKWIHNINYGEILERDLQDCSTEGNFVEKLLAKVYHFSQMEESPFTIEGIHSDLLTYFEKVGLIYIEIHTFMREATGAPGTRHATAVRELKEDFKHLCKAIQQELAPFTVAPSTDLLSSLGEIHEVLMVFRGMQLGVGVQDSLTNIQNNLFLQLQKEMAYHEKLQPLDSYLHLSTVLLLNQMIAEKYFYCLLDAGGVHYHCGEIDHDLAELVKLLGMRQEDFTPEESEFLSRGKAIRSLTRYPAIYSADRKKQLSPGLRSLVDATQAAIGTAQKIDFQKCYHLDEGYKLPEELEAKLVRFKELVKEDIRLLSNIMVKTAQAQGIVLENAPVSHI